MTGVGVLTGAPERRTRWLGGLAVFMMVMTPLLGYLAPKQFAALLSLVGLLAAPGLLRRRPPLLPMFALALLALWSLVSLTWTPALPDPAKLKKFGAVENFTAIKLFLQLGLYGAAVAMLGQMSARSARGAARVMLVCAGALALIICLDGLLGAPIYQAIRKASGDPLTPDLAMVKVSMGTYPLVLLLWPCARVLGASTFKGRNILVALLFALILLVAHVTGADAPVAALLLGGLVWLGVRLIGKPVARALIPLVSAIFIFAPMAMLWGEKSGVVAWLHGLVPPSWDHRLNIWAFAADRILEHPMRGWGIDASRTFGAAIPLHTHNAPLQIWLELGAFGAAMAAAFYAWILYGVVRWTGVDRRDGAMAAGALVSYLVVSGFSFGVWQEWWLALGALAVIACGVAQKTSASTR
ncbi:O-antigen ligase family protein [Caulobacter segnis]|uniref:O-antigen polymerase n=2 Tax=Caulobacter segnis TaxID=88688 RepID=D5VLM1_CAUST|nr:O-antigen ligase family protein [Caulobacter segnis]ADG11394.1 O-antigen polymerase [Caulobacter segnis ATCC 21756]AVQ03062.1 O-antigen ligase family protein [Caulobacter segnis]